MHVGSPTSLHNNAVKFAKDLMKISRHIDKVLNAQTVEEVQKNRLRLMTTIESVRWLSLQAYAFRCHDESSASNNRGNFLEMIRLIGRLNVDIDDVVLEKALKNAKYTSPTIQKEILHILANKVRKKICEEVRDVKFCILVDEAKDASNKEQIAIVLRFVDIQGFVREPFLVLCMFQILLLQHLKKKFVMCLLDITCIFSICEVKGMMVLAICVVHGMDYELYFSEIVLMHIMYIALLTNYNWH